MTLILSIYIYIIHFNWVHTYVLEVALVCTVDYSDTCIPLMSGAMI